MIKSWSILKLKEFNSYFNQMYEILDDWIVVSVEKENEQSEQIIKNIKLSISDEVQYLDQF